MKILVMGTGAVGSLYGGKLACAVAQAQGLPLKESRADEHIEGSQTPAMSAFPTSMAHDLARSKRLEYDALNGAVVRFGERLGIPVPLNRTFYGLLARLDPASHPSSSA